MRCPDCGRECGCKCLTYLIRDIDSRRRSAEVERLTPKPPLLPLPKPPQVEYRPMGPRVETWTTPGLHGATHWRIVEPIVRPPVPDR